MSSQNGPRLRVTVRDPLHELQLSGTRSYGPQIAQLADSLIDAQIAIIRGCARAGANPGFRRRNRSARAGIAELSHPPPHHYHPSRFSSK
jgi:hypothetical protein